MKKLLSILSTVSLTAATPLAVVACGGGKAKTVKQPKPDVKPSKPPTTVTKNKISLSSIKDVTDKKVFGNPFLNFKLPINLYDALADENLRTKTQEKRKMIYDNVDSFIKNFVKEKIHEKVLEIDNSLTKNDYDITFLYPNSTRDYNSRYKSIAMDFIIEGKNKATGKIQKELTVDVTDL